MEPKETKRKTTFPAVFATFVLCYLFWILLTGSFAAQELIVGAVVSILMALFSARFFVHEHPFWFLANGCSSCFGTASPSSPGSLSRQTGMWQSALYRRT